MYFYLYVCPYAPRGQRCPELRLHVVMSYVIRVLGAELWSFARTVHRAVRALYP